jgi:hypothetical protein
LGGFQTRPYGGRGIIPEVSEGEASLRSLVTYPRGGLWGYEALEEVWVPVVGQARRG